MSETHDDAEVELELSPEDKLENVRKEISALRDYELALVEAIDLKTQEEEARHPRPSFIEEARRIQQREAERKLAALKRGQSPLSDLDKAYLARGRKS